MIDIDQFKDPVEALNRVVTYYAPDLAGQLRLAETINARTGLNFRAGDPITFETARQVRDAFERRRAEAKQSNR